MDLIIKKRRSRWLEHVQYYTEMIEYQSKACIGKWTIMPSKNQEELDTIYIPRVGRPLVWPEKMLNNLQSTEKSGIEVWPM